MFNVVVNTMPADGLATVARPSAGTVITNLSVLYIYKGKQSYKS